jgi:hypothetical protein
VEHGGSQNQGLRARVREAGAQSKWRATMSRSSVKSITALAALVAAASVLSSAAAQRGASRPAPADELEQNFLAEHEIGRRYQIDPADLSAPKTGPIVTDRPLTIPYTRAAAAGAARLYGDTIRDRACQSAAAPGSAQW